jgi:hypothetical protein
MLEEQGHEKDDDGIGDGVVLFVYHCSKLAKV